MREYTEYKKMKIASGSSPQYMSSLTIRAMIRKMNVSQ